MTRRLQQMILSLLQRVVLLVAAGEQEDFRSFFAPQKSIAAPLALWLCQRPKKLTFWDTVLTSADLFAGRPSGRLEGRFPPARLLLPGGRSGSSALASGAAVLDDFAEARSI